MTHDKFPRASRRRRGYQCKQVESFLSRVEASLGGHHPPMLAGDVRRVGFELVRHGYDIMAVDAHLDALEERVLERQSAVGGRRRRSEPERDTQVLLAGLDKPYRARFPRTAALRRGYDVVDVDVFIDKVTAALTGTGAVTVDEVRSASFDPARGGYDEDAVDETLDRVVELLLAQRHESAPRTDQEFPDVETAGPAI